MWNKQVTEKLCSMSTQPNPTQPQPVETQVCFGCDLEPRHKPPTTVFTPKVCAANRMGRDLHHNSERFRWRMFRAGAEGRPSTSPLKMAAISDWLWARS